MSQYRHNSILNLIFNYSNVVFNLITGVFLVPLYLRSIPIDAYGSFLAAVAIAGLIGLLEFGLSMVLTQRLAYSYARSDWSAFRRITHTGMVAATLLAAVTGILTVFIAPWIPLLTKTSPAYTEDIRTAFLLLGIAAVSSIYLNLFGSIFQAMLKAGILGAINLFSASAGIATVIIGFNWYSTLTAVAAGTAVRVGCATVLLMITALLFLHRSSLLPQRTHFGETLALLRSCVPIFVGGVAKSIAENAQNLLLVNAVSPSSVAILALTQKAFQVCNMVLAPIGSSIYANLTQLREKTNRIYFSSLLGMSIRGHFLLSVLLVTTAFTFNEPFVSLWVGTEKFGGLGLSALQGIAMLLLARFSFFSFLNYSIGEFKKPLLQETCYSITKIILLFALLQHFGLYAVPLADVIAGLIFLYCSSTRLMSRHVQDSPFRTGIYFNGWFELAILAGVGHSLLTWISPIHSWSTLIFSIVSYLLAATIATLAMNTSFFKACLQHLRPKLLSAK